VAAYQNFLTNLVSAQGYYVKPVIQMLLSNFVGFEDSHSTDLNQSFNSEKVEQVLFPIHLVFIKIGSWNFIFFQLESLIFSNTHLALKSIMQVTRFASDQALRIFSKECMPYLLTTNPK